MEIILKVDSERLSFEDLLALEDAQEGKRPFHSMARIFAKFIVGPDGNFVNLEEGIEILKPLNLSQINALAVEFGKAVQESQKSAVPPTKSGN